MPYDFPFSFEVDGWYSHLPRLPLDEEGGQSVVLLTGAQTGLNAILTSEGVEGLHQFFGDVLLPFRAQHFLAVQLADVEAVDGRAFFG